MKPPKVWLAEYSKKQQQHQKQEKQKQNINDNYGGGRRNISSSFYNNREKGGNNNNNPKAAVVPRPPLANATTGVSTRNANANANVALFAQHLLPVDQVRKHANVADEVESRILAAIEQDGGGVIPLEQTDAVQNGFGLFRGDIPEAPFEVEVDDQVFVTGGRNQQAESVGAPQSQEAAQDVEMGTAAAAPQRLRAT